MLKKGIFDRSRTQPGDDENKPSVGVNGYAQQEGDDSESGVAMTKLRARKTRIAKPACDPLVEAANDESQVGKSQREQMNFAWLTTLFYGVTKDEDDDDVEEDADNGAGEARRMPKAVKE